MNRRSLLVGVSGVLAMTSRKPAVAQTPDASPTADDENVLIDLPTTQGIERLVYRKFSAGEPDLSDILSDELQTFSVATALYDSEDNASQGLDYVREIIEHPTDRGLELPPNPGQEASMQPFGDERIALLGTFDVGEDAPIDDIKFGVTCVRKQRQLQITIGAAFAGNPIPAMEAFVRLLDSRWPDDTEEAQDADGNPSGGLWSAIPVLADMPSGFIVEEESDETFAIGERLAL